MNLESKNNQAQALKNTPTPIQENCAKENEYSFNGLPCCQGLVHGNQRTGSGSFTGVICVKRTPTGSGSPPQTPTSNEDVNSCPPPAQCSRATVPSKNECGVGYDPLKNDSGIVSCTLNIGSNTANGICCIPKIVTPTSVPNQQYQGPYSCWIYCSSIKKIPSKEKQYYYKRASDRIAYFDENKKYISSNQMNDYCGCTDQANLSTSQKITCNSDDNSDINKNDNIAYIKCCFDEKGENCYGMTYKFE